MIFNVIAGNGGRGGGTKAVQIHYVIHDSIADLHSLQRASISNGQTLYSKRQYLPIVAEVFGRCDYEPIVKILSI